MLELLSCYPRALGEDLYVRPLRSDDEQLLADFFRRMPVDERQLFKEDVTNLSVIRGWIRNLNYTNILPLLVFQGSRVVADATLHRDRRGWSRHVAEVRISLDPDFRGLGLGRTLIQEFMGLAYSLRVAILTAAVLDVQREARELFESLGFLATATLPQQAIDLAGRVHDVIVYALTVIPPERLAPEASWTEEVADVGGGA